MKKARVKPNETAALSHVLEGEFTFYGLISTRATLPSPLSSWTYKRSSEHFSRTVTCTSRGNVPHAQDATVLNALLLIQRNRSAEDPDGHCTADFSMIKTAIATIGQGKVPGYIAVVSSLRRLTAAQMNIQYTRDAAGIYINLTFPFLTSISSVRDSRGETIQELIYSLSSHVVSLYRTGELTPSAEQGKLLP